MSDADGAIAGLVVHLSLTASDMAADLFDDDVRVVVFAFVGDGGSVGARGYGPENTPEQSIALTNDVFNFLQSIARDHGMSLVVADALPFRPKGTG